VYCMDKLMEGLYRRQRALSWAPCAIQQLPTSESILHTHTHTHTHTHMSVLLFQFISPSPSISVSKSPFSMSVSLFLPFTEVHQYHFSRFHIYVLIYEFVFFLTYFTAHAPQPGALWQPRGLGWGGRREGIYADSRCCTVAINITL